MDRGDNHGVQDVLPVPSLECGGGSGCEERLDVVWERDLESPGRSPKISCNIGKGAHSRPGP